MEKWEFGNPEYVAIRRQEIKAKEAKKKQKLQGRELEAMRKDETLRITNGKRKPNQRNHPHRLYLRVDK